jgi:hypothetical protein
MAESITLQTSDSNVQPSDVLGRLSFAASNESNTADARLVGASIHAEADSEFTEIANPTSLVFSTAYSESATGKIKITSSGHFIPLSNKTYDIGSSSLKFRNLYGETNYTDKLVLASGFAPSPTTNSLYNLSGILYYEDKAVALLPSGQTDFTESVDDIVNSLLVEGTGVQLTYNDSGNLLTIDNAHTEINELSFEPQGFVNRHDSLISFNDATRTFTIQPSGSSYDVYIEGKKVTKTTTETVVIDSGTALNYIHFDTDTYQLQTKTTFFNFDTDVPIAFIHWNSGIGQSTFFGEERHGIRMDSNTHKWIHNTFGMQYIDGLSIGNYILLGNGSSNSHAQISISDGTLYQEDIIINIADGNDGIEFTQELSPIAYIPVYYHSGNTGQWIRDSGTPYPLKYNATRALYNVYSGGSWTVTNVTNNRYFAMWIIATNDINDPVLAVMGQREDSSLGSAENNNNWSDINLTNIPTNEIRPLYRLIFNTNDTFTNTPKSSLQSILDLRKTILASTVGVTQNDHGSLFGLGDDDHTQYVHINESRTISANHTFTNGLTINNGLLSATSGNFTSLTVNSTGVSVSGHTHVSSDITNFNNSVSGLLPTITNSGDNRILTSTGSTVGVNAETNLTFDGSLLNINGSGLFASGLNISNQTVNTIASFDSSKNLSSLSTTTYPSLTELSYIKGVTSAVQTQLDNKAASSHTHTSSNITDFNSSVSGLLPVKDISAGTGISISSVGGTYTINSTGGGGSSTTELVYTYAATSGLPASGDANKLYIITDSNRIYRWIDNTNKYVETGPIGGGDTSLWNLFLPPAPTGVTGTVGSSQVALSWSAPTVAAQTPITDYIIQYSSNSGSSWSTFADGTSTATSGTVTGLTNGTGYIFKVAAVNIIGTGNYSSSSSTLTPAAGDSYFGNVQLLLRADGSGSSFTDSSLYTRTITAYGNATQSSTQSKFGGLSASFDGNGDWLSVASTPNIGTDDFVLEFWMRVADVSAYQHIIGTSTTNNFMVALLAPYNGAGAIGIGRNNIAWDFVRNATLSNNTWHHVAISRNSGTMRIYVDGSIVGSSGSNTQSYPIGTMEIGATSAGATGPLNGYIDDLRLTIGSSRSYTGSTITVPTATYSNTYAGIDPYFSAVSMLLHGDGTGSTFTDNSSNSNVITANGSVTQSTAQSKFGGKSILFTSSNSFLTFPSSNIFNFSNDFTIEAWVYPTSYVTYATILEGRTSASYQNYVCGLYYTGGVYRLDFVNDGGAGTRLTASSTSVALNQWSHIAFVRSGSTLACYVNGTKDSTTVSYSSSLTNASSTLTIGKNVDGNYFDGYIDDYRITKMVRYSGSSFTVPSSAFSDS